MQDIFPIRRIDHIRFVVGNAKQTADWYHRIFGFDLVAYGGLETGLRTEAGYVLEQGEVRFLISTPLTPDHPWGSLLARHGDFVRDIAFEVDDVDEAYKVALSRGAQGVQEPTTIEDSCGEVRLAAVQTYGDVIHSLINRDRYVGPFLPRYREQRKQGDSIGLEYVDHIVGNVEFGKMNYWVDWYKNVLGFSLLISFDDKDISTEYTALMSKVMEYGGGRIKFPINEPAQGKKKSQIDEYLEFHGGPGVQHIALHTSDILRTVSAIKERGLDFLYVPSTYYDDLADRVGKIDERIDALKELGILVDRDDEGYLLQIFSKPVEDRPTLFYEIIQRKGARSFGKGNFKALFEAIEREQALRETL